MPCGIALSRRNRNATSINLEDACMLFDYQQGYKTTTERNTIVLQVFINFNKVTCQKWLIHLNYA